MTVEQVPTPAPCDSCDCATSSRGRGLLAMVCGCSCHAIGGQLSLALIARTFAQLSGRRHIAPVPAHLMTDEQIDQLPDA